MKDLIIVRGRNVYPQDLEVAAEQAHPSVEPNAGAAFSIEWNDSEEVLIAIEIERGAQARPEEIVEAVRSAIAAEFEISLFDVVLLRTGTLPRTTSGKVQRSRCRAAYLAGALDMVSKRPSRQVESSVEAATDLERVRTRDRGRGAERGNRPAFHYSAGELRPRFTPRVAALSPPGKRAAIWRSRSSSFWKDGRSARSRARSPRHAAGQFRYVIRRAGDHAGAAGAVFARANGASRTPNNLYAAAWCEEPLDAGALRKAAFLLSRRHAALRTTFVEHDGEIRPRIFG